MNKEIVELIEMVHNEILTISSAFDCGSDFNQDCEDSLCGYKRQCKNAIKIDAKLKEIKNKIAPAKAAEPAPDQD